MRAAPALLVCCGPDRAWGHARRVAAIIGLLVVFGWCLHRLWWEQPLTWPVTLFVSIGAIWSVWVWNSAADKRPLVLRWDGTHWTLAVGATVSDIDAAHFEEEPGNLAVAIDLGRWMLLRFTASRRDRHVAMRGFSGRPGHWLALSESNHRAQWHALRCAVYSVAP